MAQVKSRKSVFVRTILDATGNFTYVINIPFHVDDIHLNSWVAGVTTAAAIDHPFLVALEGIGDIGCMTENDFDSPRHVYNVNRPVVGVQRFTVRNANNEVVDRTGCQLMFCLEFIEFHRD